MPAKLRIILNPDDTRKLLLPDGIPETMEQLMDEVRKVCSLNGDFRLQYQDKDFGDALVNLTSTAELEDLTTIKVIPITDHFSQGLKVTVFDDTLSSRSDDTDILSSPSSSVSTRSQMWPREFPIPKFSYDTELQLEKGNAEYRSNKTRLTQSTKTKSDILEKVAEEIFKFKAYPTDADFSDVAEALIKKHPSLSEPGSYNGCYGWKQRLKTKMGNYRTQLKAIGCSEVLANSLKSKCPEDAMPAKKIKRPRRGEANHIPDIPTGETPEKLENLRLSLLTEVKKRDNRAVIKDKMAKTFSLRRQEIVEKEPGVEELRERWPALFTEDEINAEFLRITTVPLQSRFLASLDKHHSKLIELIRSKGGLLREKTQKILKVLDQSLEVNIKRECLLKCLILYLGEDLDRLIKEYLVVQKDEAETELGSSTMAVFIIREEGDPLQPPLEIGIVIEGELPLSLAACTNQPDVVDFLMENEYQRVDAKLTDSQGNTVLHALVVVADNSKENTEFITSIYDHILKTTARLHPKLKLEDIKNRKGLTPLKMAAKTGKIGLFSHILQREFQESHTKHLSRKFTEWVYGPVHCSLYDLASLDLYEDKSVIEILVYGSDIPNRHEMLETEPLSQLLENKWKTFAGRMFFFNFLVYLSYLIIFTIVAYNKKDGEPPFPIEHNVWGYLYVSGQLLMTLANFYFFFIGIVDMKRKNPKLQTLLIDGYYEILFFVQGVLFLTSAGLYLCGRLEYLGFLVLCLALSWLNLLYYSRGDRHMGIYSVMIQKMILSDILRFLFVYVVFLFGFSSAVVTLLIEPPKKNITQAPKTRFYTRPPENTDEEHEPCFKPSFRNISYTTLQLFKFTIGMGDMEFTQGYQYKEVFYVLLIGYIILTYILLLNMLIALMNRTVEKITMESASIWKLQRAVTILDMEKRLPNCLKKRFRCGVEIKLGTALGDDRRQCFRVEEVNWNKWNINLGKINEDPGCWDRVQQPTPDTPPNRPRGRSWRGFFTEGSRRWRAYQSTEMSSSPV